MELGFVKLSAACPQVKVGDVQYNLASAKAALDRAEALGCVLLVLPELHLTAYTCGDLFYSDLLLSAAREALQELREYSRGKRCLTAVGLPLRLDGKLYNCAAVVQDGAVLGLVPKSILPNYGEFYEKRQFSSGNEYSGPNEVRLCGETIPFGSDLLFC